MNPSTPRDGAALRGLVLDKLRSVAPELEPERLRDDLPLREQIELDSMDWLNFIIRLHQALQVDIPEADYRLLVSLTDIVAYLQDRL